MDFHWYWIEILTWLPMNFYSISLKFALVFHSNSSWISNGFSLMFIEFQLDFQLIFIITQISICISSKFQVVFHWNFNLISNWFLQVSLNFQIKSLIFNWGSTVFQIVFNKNFIKILTWFPMDFYWYFIEISPWFPMDFYW